MIHLSYAALVVVPGDWRPGMPVAVSQSAYHQWRETFRRFQPVLVYQSCPVNAIVAEGELECLDGWMALGDCPSTLTLSGTQGDYLLPLQVLYTRPIYSYIPLHHICKWVQNPTFPNVEWIPITQAAYDEFSDWS